MEGSLLINKPVGLSSFAVVRKVRSFSGVKKVGHAGTLDPLASGLLIMLLGKATKQQEQMMKLDKAYEAEITLGATSTTDDAEGIISKKQNVISKKPTAAEVKAALAKFEGVIEQVPPQFSAIKVGGQRAYRLARSGKIAELKARPVTIKSLELVSYRYPQLCLQATVSSGTYIRSLAREVGQALGTGAYLSRLVRIQIGPYRLDQALPLADLDSEQLNRYLRPIALPG